MEKTVKDDGLTMDVGIELNIADAVSDGEGLTNETLDISPEERACLARLGATLIISDTEKRAAAIEALAEDEAKLSDTFRGAFSAIKDEAAHIRRAMELDAKIAELTASEQDIAWAERVLAFAEEIASENEATVLYCSRHGDFRKIADYAKEMVERQAREREERIAERVQVLDGAISDIMKMPTGAERCVAIKEFYGLMELELPEVVGRIAKYKELSEEYSKVDIMLSAVEIDRDIQALASESRDYAWAKRVLEYDRMLTAEKSAELEYCAARDELSGLVSTANGIVSEMKTRADALRDRIGAYRRMKNSEDACQLYTRLRTELEGLPEELFTAEYRRDFLAIEEKLPMLRQAAQTDKAILDLSHEDKSVEWAERVLELADSEQAAAKELAEKKVLKRLVVEAEGVLNDRDRSAATELDRMIEQLAAEDRATPGIGMVNPWIGRVNACKERLEHTSDSVKALCKKVVLLNELLQDVERIKAEDEAARIEMVMGEAADWDRRVLEVFNSENSEEKCRQIESLNRELLSMSSEKMFFCKQREVIRSMYSGLGALRATVKNAQINIVYERAKAGDAEAQLEVGKCFYDGIGVDKNCALAFKWFEKAAKKKNWQAMQYLGICYRNGEGVKQSPEKALKWFKKAEKYRRLG